MIRHLVDRELHPMLDALPSFDFTEDILLLARKQMATMIEPVEAYSQPDVTISERLVPGPDGAPDVRVVVYRPRHAAGALPVYINMHGGGYLMGAPEFGGRVNVETAAEAGCAVVSVDYRLAPDHPSPAALDDCYAVLGWVNRAAAEEGFDAGRVAVGGDSAGGGLAAALAILARDRGEYGVHFQLLIYPMLDDRTAVRDDIPAHLGKCIFSNVSNHFAWSRYLAAEPGTDAISAYQAPARLTDFAGLPPAYIGVGTLDLFLQENLAYAERLQAAAVPVELHVFPGAFHSFDRDPNAAIARRAAAEFRAALARGLA